MEGDNPSGYCSVTPNNYIHTFDMLSTKLPNHQCEIVLAKDCSALNIFMVTMKPTETGKKIITIYLPDKIIEVIPAEETAASTHAFTIKINGEVIDMPNDNTPHIIEEGGKQILKFIANRDKVYFSSYKYLLVVETDCISTFIKPSDLYRGQLCGACSDFESSLRNELRGPNNELYNTPGDFLESYTIRTPGCEAPLVATPCEMVERNVVFERFVKGEMKICIGVEPIKQCSGACTPREPRQISQTFHCESAHLQSARRQRAEAEMNALFLTPAQGDYKEIVTEYQTCSPAH